MIYVVVNRHRVAANKKLAPDDRLPVMRVSKGKKGRVTYAHSIIFHGTSELINGNGEPVMPCGATIAQRTRWAVTLTVDHAGTLKRILP